MIYGHLQMGSISIPIQNIRLHDGNIVFSGNYRGPAPAYTGPITIFGKDGSGIGQVDGLVIGRVPWLGVGHVSVSMRIETLISEGN